LRLGLDRLHLTGDRGNIQLVFGCQTRLIHPTLLWRGTRYTDKILPFMVLFDLIPLCRVQIYVSRIVSVFKVIVCRAALGRKEYRISKK
jgi:hypothetical protein